MPRVAPITGKADVPAQYHGIVDEVLKVFGNVRGPFSMLLHSPRLAERMLGIGNFYRDESIVAGKDRSLAILVGVRERQGAYVWAAQVNAARRAGVREEAIDVIRKKGDAGKLTAEEREIITYAEQLFRKNRVEQAAFDALVKRHGVQWLVELTASATYYGILCGIVNAFEVAAPPDGDKLPS
jgi:4-carboxymuconolactone decarboxylase